MGTGFGSGAAPGFRVVRRYVGVFPAGVSPHPRLSELSLAVWTVAGEAATPAALGGFLVDGALSPLPASSAARTKKEVLDKLVDGDSVPIDLLSQFEAAVRPGRAVPDDGQLRKLTEQHRHTCDTLQTTEDAQRSARQDLVHQRKMHDVATERLQSRIDDVQVQVTKLVQTPDRNHTATEGAGTVDTRIQPAAKTLSCLQASSVRHASSRCLAVSFGETPPCQLSTD